MSKAIVIFSGGQDSTTCMGWAKSRFDEVIAVSYMYGQTHDIEIQQAKRIANSLSVPLHIFDISFYASMVHSALLGQGDMDGQHELNSNLPASFVPNRNALFILLAHSFALTTKANTLITGVCQTDFSGYPDCRLDFIRSIETSLNLGAGSEIKLLTPLMHLTKAETFELARKEGVLDLVLKESHTCYNGDSKMNEWGRGCGGCPACKLREKGYIEFKEQFGGQKNASS